MTKAKTRWICQECGFEFLKFLGRCTECNNWNCLIEETSITSSGSLAAFTSMSLEPVALDCVPTDDATRLPCHIEGVAEVLGGGLVAGSVTLIAGAPGIGKSTLLLQLSETIPSHLKVLYVAGEESISQIKLRADRLGVSSNSIDLCAEQNILNIEKRLTDGPYKVAVIDSIQSVYHPDLTSSSGSVSQVRESAAVLARVAKSRGIATILVGHVTKDGTVAGPRVLEHMVDVVLQFEGDRLRQLRVLRAVKNRFGATSEIALFTMAGKGLEEVKNPSDFFLAGRLAIAGVKQAPSGTAVIAGMEGTRAMIYEVQALVGRTAYPSPRRVSNGWDNNRLLQVLAVLEKKVGINCAQHDVYINLVGGFEVSDQAGDLGIATACATSALDRSINPGLILIGEIGLSGEIRPVINLENRLKEAAKMGFTHAIVPASNLPCEIKSTRLKLTGVQFLVDALNLVMPGSNFPVEG